MNQEKLNLINKKELETKSYKELQEMERDFMHNPEATDLDLAVVSATILERELEMGIDNTTPWEEVIDELLKGTEFENKNKRNCKIRTVTN